MKAEGTESKVQTQGLHQGRKKSSQVQTWGMGGVTKKDRKPKRKVIAQKVLWARSKLSLDRGCQPAEQRIKHCL